MSEQAICVYIMQVQQPKACLEGKGNVAVVLLSAGVHGTLQHDEQNLWQPLQLERLLVLCLLLAIVAHHKIIRLHIIDIQAHTQKKLLADLCCVPWQAAKVHAGQAHVCCPAASREEPEQRCSFILASLKAVFGAPSLRTRFRHAQSAGVTSAPPRESIALRVIFLGADLM